MQTSYSPSGWTLLFKILFWIFNGTLLLIVYLGFMPFLGIGFLTDLIAGNVPLNFLLPFVGLVGVPTACSVVGVRKKQRQSVRTSSFSLVHLFFGVEMPLLLFSLIRFFMLRDLTPASGLLLLIGVFGTITYVHWFINDPDGDLTSGADNDLNSNNPLRDGLHLTGLTLALGLAVYGLTISAFFFPIFIMAMAVLPFLIVAFPLAVLVVGFLSAPMGIAVTYYNAWGQVMQHLGKRYGKTKVRGLTAGILAVGLAAVLLLQQQPQVKAFELLQTPPKTPQAQQALVQKSGVIRQGLLNAYLSQYRYPHDQNSQLLQYYYGSSDDGIQALYNWVTTPFIYQGSARDDQQKAAELYAQFFDQPIQRAELPAIEKALNSTFDRTAAKAGLNDINTKRVWLEEQRVTVIPQGDWADVEVYEVYDNRTNLDEEVLYYFSLPESAAITGLWLGESPDVASRYRFVVSPRGAAQKVYTDQVHRVNPTDPALLEQVGPRNYRLRAFPILPKGQGKMHLWLTYKVLQQDSGWTMPVLHEKRNLFWTGATKRFVNGKRVRARDQWLPNTLSAKAAEPVTHQMPLSWGGNVLAVPYGQDKLQLPQGKRFALVLDGSYSMNAHQQDVNQTFKWLEQNLLPQNQADLYLTAATPAQPQRLDRIQSFDPKSNSKTTSFYGSMEPRTMLSQFLELRQDRAYDAVILITDPGSYELSKDEKAVLNLPAPLWFVHLGGLQLAYDDATLQAIQDSGGGISTNVQEVAYRLGTQPTLGEDTSLINLTDGYAWFLSKTPNASALADEGFYPVNTRQWIAQLGEEVKPGELVQLDTIHALAKEQEIVTPYSSMLVLVNAEQRAALKNAEQQGDRFNRELEDQQLPQPTSSSLNSSVIGVPEPQEWLLLFVTGGLLGVVYRLRQPQETVI